MMPSWHGPSPLSFRKSEITRTETSVSTGYRRKNFSRGHVVSLIAEFCPRKFLLRSFHLRFLLVREPRRIYSRSLRMSGASKALAYSFTQRRIRRDLAYGERPIGPGCPPYPAD